MLNLFKRKRKLDQSSTSQPAPKPIQEAEASVRLRANIGYQQLEQRKVLSASFIGSAGGLIVDSFAPGQDLVFSQTTSVINGTAQDSFALEVSSGSFLGSTINPLIELESVNGGTNNRLEVATNLFGGAANAQISLDGATSVGSEVEFDQAGGPINFASLDISNFTNQDRGFSLNTIGDVTASNISVVDSNPLDSLDPAANLSINTQGSITTTGSIENSIDNPLDGVSLIASGQNNDITVVDRIETLSGSIVLSAGDSVQLASTGQILSGGAGDTTITSGTSPATGNSGDQISMTDGSRIDVGFGQANLTAQGDVLISEITSLASGDAITITTSQQIIDNTAAESDNVISNNGRSRFLSTGDIGGSGAANINIQADSLEFDTDGSATISDSNAGLTIDRASRADGGAAIDSSGPLTISQNIDVGASSSFTTNNSTSIDDDLTINNNAIVSLSTTLGAQLEFTAGDDIVFDGGSFATTGGNSIVLIADNEGAIDADRGSISNSSSSVTNIFTTELTAVAFDGIGDLGTPLRTDVDRLVASNSGTGNIQIDDDSAIELVSVQTVDGSIVVNAVGDIEATSVTSGETEPIQDNSDNVEIVSSLGSINVSNIDAADELSLSAFDAITDNPNSQIASGTDASFNSENLIDLADSAGDSLLINGNASFTANTISVGADSQFAGVVAPTAAQVELGSLTLNGTTATIIEDDSTSFSGASQINDLFLASADQIDNQAETTLTVSGQAQFTAPNQIVLGNQANDVIDIATVGLVSNNVHIETDTDLIIDGTAPDQTATAIGTTAANGTQVDQTLFVVSAGSVNQAVGELNATNIGIDATQFVHLSDVSENNEAISISAGFAGALTDADLIQQLNALENIENSEVNAQLDQSIALNHLGTLNVTTVDSHLGTDSLSGLTTTQGSVFASADQNINLFENISASSTTGDPQVTVYSASGTSDNPAIQFVGGTIDVTGLSNIGLVNGNQTFSTLFDENDDPLLGTTTLLLLNTDGSADQDIVVEYGRLGEIGYRVGIVYDSENQPGQPVETLNTFVPDPLVATEAFEDAIFQNNPNIFLPIGGNEGGQETFSKVESFSAEAIILHQDEPNVFAEVTVRNDQDINLFTGPLETASNALNENMETLLAQLDSPPRFAPDLPTINSINDLPVRMTADVPLGSSSPDSSSGVTFSRDVQSFESGDLKWVQVEIPISELEEIDGEVRLKDATKVFGKTEDADVNDLDDEIGENEVEKIIEVIETNEESEAGYWYKVFKDYRNRDDELFFYHFKTGEAQQTDSQTDSQTESESAETQDPNSDSQPEPESESNPRPDSFFDNNEESSEPPTVPDAKDGNRADLPESDFANSADDNFQPASVNFASEPSHPEQLKSLEKTQSLSPGGLLVASLLLQKFKARKIQANPDHQQPPQSPQHHPQTSPTPTKTFSRSDRLKRKIKRLLDPQ